jgi:hypothetical protein
LKSFEIFFNDLNEDAQKRFLEFQEIDSAADGNYDIDVVPLAIFNREED